MPAVSKKQAIAMNIAKAVQKGQATAKQGSPSAEIARSMAPSDVADFASTPQQGLPTRAPAPPNMKVVGKSVRKMAMPMAKGGKVKAGGCK